MRKNTFPSLHGLLTAALILLASFSLQAQLTDVTQPGDPIVPTSNNSPGSEGVANAIDNQPTKYLNFDKLNTGFTVTPRVGLSVVQCLTLTSANDAPERDPASFVLSGSYDGSNFVQIAADNVPAFSARFQKVVIRFANNTPYLAYKLVFPTVANATAANSMQVSEVELLGFLAPTDVTQPGDPIVPTSNNSPGSEGVANSIDNQPTKYLNFDKLNTGFTVTPNVGATLVSGLTLTSANDAPERDPASYLLQGSFDGTTFFDISSGTVPAFPARFYKNYIFFSNSRAYRAYRLIFPTVANAGSANSMQISEVELLGDVADLAQDITLPGDPITPTSNNSPGSEGVANSIDNQPTKYLNFDKLNTGFTVNPGARGLTVVSGLTLTSANDAPERDPASYVLSGSYDGTNFTDISSGTVGTFANRFQKQTILFDNKVPYLQYKLIFPTVANAASANSMQVSEVELLGVLADTDVTTPGDPIVATSNNSPGSEGVANAIDNQPTKYLNFDKLNTGFTVTPRVGGTILIGLSLTSANDAPERDPASYDLSGSEDGVNFVPISSGTVPPFPARFAKQYVFFPDNTKEYSSYRLIFPTVANAGSANSMQISEVEFLGHQRGGGSCTIETNGLLITRQPADAPVLLGSTATFRVGLSGPWKVQWYKNGVPIPGANNAVYTTPAAAAADDGTRYQVKVGPATVSGTRGLCETSAEVMLNIFTPSTTECIGLNFHGSGANGAPTDMLPTDITGFAKQAYWNNLAGGSGTLANPINSSNAADPTITVNWSTSGEWGIGTGNGSATERMFNGAVTSFSTDEASAQTVTFSGVPAGNHTILLYTVQVPQEFFNMNFKVVTHDSGGNDVVQSRYIRPLNADEYNPFPGFFLVPSDTPETRGVGSMMRFDNLVPGSDGVIQIQFWTPGRVDLPGGDPIRGPGLNAVQLCLNPAPAGAPPIITRQPVSANGIAGGCITLSAEATGPGLTYQWYKNGQVIAGATSPNLTVANLSAGSAGNYVVVVSNPAGNVRSKVAVVEVLSSNQLTLGLVAQFKLDDAGGATTANSAPGGQPGQVRGSAPSAVPGQIGNGLAFNGADNYIYVPNYTKVGRAMTVSGWVQPFLPGPLVNNWVEGQVTGSSGQFLVDLADDGTGVLVFRAQIEVGPNRVLAMAPLPDPSQTDPFTWHLFAVSANGVTLSLYWDGQFLGSVDYLGTINSTASLPWLAIGGSLDIGGNLIPPPYSGNIDDVALWSRSLGATEIQAIYTGGLGGQDVSQVPPILTPGTCPPTINCPGNITAETTGGLTPVTFDVTATDTSGNAVPVVCVPPSGTGFRIGSSNVVCSATVGNQSSSCSFRVTVVDTTPPTIACSSNITANATGPNGAVVTYIASASDVGGIAGLDCLPPSGSTFPAGTTTVTCRTADLAGNSNSCSFTVTVLADTTPPAVTCPGDITADATSAAGAVVTYIASATDSGGIASFACVPPSGSTFPIGATTVTCTAVDNANNSASCSFRITVRSNNQPPTAVISTDQLVDIPGFDHPVLISCNWWNACLIADGLGSSDPEGGALTYLWFLEPDPVPFAAGPVVTNCLEVGEHTITLVVTDPTGLTGTDSKTLEVVTAPLGIELLIEEVNSGSLKSAISRKIKRELTETLRVALDFAGDNKLRETQKALDAFEKKVRAQVTPNYPAEATKWIRWSQAVSEGMEKCIKPPRKHGDDNKDEPPKHK